MWLLFRWFYFCCCYCCFWLVVICLLLRFTGVCKIHGVFVVVSCWKTNGITMIDNSDNTVYFANTGMLFVVCCPCFEATVVVIVHCHCLLVIVVVIVYWSLLLSLFIAHCCCHCLLLSVVVVCPCFEALLRQALKRWPMLSSNPRAWWC